MQVTFEVPDDIARALTSGEPLRDRTALESVAAEGYRSGLLAESQVMRLLNVASRFEVHDCLLCPFDATTWLCQPVLSIPALPHAARHSSCEGKVIGKETLLDTRRSRTNVTLGVAILAVLRLHQERGFQPNP